MLRVEVRPQRLDKHSVPPIPLMLLWTHLRFPTRRWPPHR